MKTLIFCIGFILLNTHSFSQLNADFSATPLSICLGEEIIFNDLSTFGGSPIVNWTWDFGDGTGSSIQNASHTYLTPGTYSVTLVIQALDGTSNVEVKPAYLVVSSLPTASFTVNTNDCTVPMEVTFTNFSSSGFDFTYEWDLDNGQTSNEFSPVGISYSNAGEYTVILDVLSSSSGCSNSDTLTFNVNDFAGGIDAPSQACVGDIVQINNASTVGSTSWGWNYGDLGTSNTENGSHIYSTSGTYTITLNVQNTANGCSDVVTQDIEILSLPTPSLTASPIIGCSPLNVTFTNTSIGGTLYNWDFGNGNTFSGETPPDEQYTSSGIYSVDLTMTDENGCTNTMTYDDLINVQELEVVFVADVIDGCDPVLTQFTDNSVPIEATDPIINWDWDFGNGVVFSGENPPIQTYTAGVYDVALTITSANGCMTSGTYVGYVEVGDIDLVNFSVDPILNCAKSPFSFTNLSVISVPHNPSEIDYDWNFGDGGSSSQQNPTYNYPVDTGYFDVQLALDFRGCKDTLIQPQVVFVKAPISSFSPSNTLFCNPSSLPLNIDFTDNSIIGAISDDAAMIWTWGDGTFDNLDDPDFDDGDLGSMSHDYSAYGTYTIQQAIYNYSTGCEDSTSVTIVISEINSDFGVSTDSVCLNSLITLTDNSNSSDSIVNYLYNMGNGSSLNGADQIYTYPASGNFDITLTTTNDEGCSDSYIYSTMNVLELPIADILSSHDFGCTDLDVIFTNNSSIAGNGVPIDFYQWTMPDLSNTSMLNTSYTFTTEGFFTTSLLATDVFGCVSLVDTAIVHLTKPSASFILDTVVCNNEQFLVTNTSDGFGALIYTWYVDGVATSGFENYTGQFDEIEDPLVLFTDHTLELIVEDAHGCLDTSNINMHVSMPNANVNYSLSGASINTEGEFVCPPVFASFVDSSSSYGEIIGWNWNYGNGNTSTVPDSSANTYVFAGTYSMDMMITDEWGCTSNDSLIDYLTIGGPSADFEWVNIGDICEPRQEFSATNQINVDNIEWILGDGNVLLDSATFDYAYGLTNTYFPQVILTDTSGCAVTYELNPISVDVNQVNALFSSSLSSGITGQEFIFMDETTGGTGPIVTWDWDFTQSSLFNSTNTDVSYAWTTPGVQLVTLSATDSNGCVGVYSLEFPIIDATNVPNVFTPNGDGVNDQLILDFNMFDNGFDLVILNRWGNTVYQVTEKEGLVLWDGLAMDGKECVDGVYFYKIKGTMLGEEILNQGHVTLLRGF